jgi:hypothetical protein
MSNNHSRFVPSIPTDAGKLAWVVSRIEQSAGMLPRSVTVHEAWVEVSPETAAALITEIGAHTVRFAGKVMDAQIECNGGSIPLAICIVDDLDDTTFMLSLETSQMSSSVATTGILGFCYDTPQAASEVETRWVLQYVDGVDGATAAALTAAL